MSTDTVRERVLRIVELQLDIDAGQVRDESQFIDDLGADSLAIVEITLAIEEAFEIDIEDEVVYRCVTVGDAVRALEVELARHEAARTSRS